MHGKNIKRTDFIKRANSCYITLKKNVLRISHFYFYNFFFCHNYPLVCCCGGCCDCDGGVCEAAGVVGSGEFAGVVVVVAEAFSACCCDCSKAAALFLASSFALIFCSTSFNVPI